MSRKKTFFTDSAVNNNATYAQYMFRLMELSVAMFEWSGLPESVDPRFIEMTLFSDGHALYFNDEVLGNLCLQAACNGPLDVYRIPTRRHAYAPNGYQKQCSEKDSVIIWNNYLHRNSYLDVLQFAKRLYNLDRIIDVNANAQKTPVIILADEKQRLTMKNVYMQWEGNMPVIFGDKNLDIHAIQALRTDAPYVADKIYQLKTQIWNEALTYLGISNVNYQKKERMISDEVIRNQGGTIANRYSRLNSRREACEKINKMFGTDIWCDFREDYREADDEIMFNHATGKDTMDTLAIDLRTN